MMQISTYLLTSITAYSLLALEGQSVHILCFLYFQTIVIVVIIIIIIIIIITITITIIIITILKLN